VPDGIAMFSMAFFHGVAVTMVVSADGSERPTIATLVDRTSMSSSRGGRTVIGVADKGVVIWKVMRQKRVLSFFLDHHGKDADR